MTIEMKLQEKLEEGIELGEKRGIELGERNKSLKIARSIKRKGLSIVDISEITGISDIEILQLKTTREK